MGYEPKQRPGFDWVADMQRRMDAKTQKVTADTASDNPRVRELATTWAALKAAGKVSEASEPEVAYEPGALVREAESFAAALERIRRSDIAEARDGYLGVFIAGGA